MTFTPIEFRRLFAFRSIGIHEVAHTFFGVTPVHPHVVLAGGTIVRISRHP